MKRILYVTTISETINAFLVPHIEYLLDNNYEVECACNIGLNLDKRLDKNLVIHDIPFSRSPLSTSNIGAYKKIKEVIKNGQYDYVHVHTPIAAFITRLATRNMNISIIYTAHGFHFYKGAPMLNWIVYYNLEKIAARWTDCIITMNEEDFILAKEKFKYKNNKIFKINGIGLDLNKYSNNSNDLREFKKSLGLKDEDFVITIIAELIKRKNHLQIIDTMKLLYKEYPNIKVLFVGKGVLKDNYKKYIEDNNLSESIKLLGFRNDVSEIINISNIIALFSLQEGLPRNLMEAMAIGKSIICTNIRGNNDLVKDNINGLLVPINDIQATKEAILKIYNDDKLAEKFSNNNINDIKKYDIKEVLNEMNLIYKDIGLKENI